MSRREESQPVNRTRENIRRKRKLLARKRRLRLLRFGVFLLVFGIVLVVLGFLCMTLYHWGSGIYAEYQVRHETYLARREARAGELDPRFDGYTNVLVLGLDDGAGGPETADGRAARQADTLLLLSVENETGRLRIVTIPRDTWVPIPDSAYEDRIGTLYGTGGAPLVVRATEQLLGVSVHQYVAVDMQTCADIIDLLGGIDLYVESDMDYDDPEADLSIHLKRGYQHLDGKQAQEYLRYRGTDLGDVGRSERQQQFVKALYEEVMRVRTLTKLPAIAEILQTRVETSAEIFDSAHLANVLRQMSRTEPETWMLSGTPAESDDTIWLPETQAIGEGVEKLFPEMQTHIDDE